MNFKVGDRVIVSDCCIGIINELDDFAAIVEVDIENGGDIIYIDIDELQLAEED